MPPCIMKSMSTMCRNRIGAGFALVSAIFLLLLMAALGAFMVSFTSTQHASSALDMEGSRAYWAARAGLDWGLYQVLDPLNATVVAPWLDPPTNTVINPTWPNFPACFIIPPTPIFDGMLAGFVVRVRCIPSDHTEGVKSVRVYQLIATASKGGAPGNAHYVERQVTATVSKCRALDGVAPKYECP